MSNSTGERLVIEEYPSHIVEEHLARYRYASTFVSGKQVLDIACGTGYGTRLLKEAGAISVCGMDISLDAVTYAHDKYSCPGVMFKQGDCASVPFENGKFDVVVSFETLEHIKNYKIFISEMGRILKDDGVFIVSTPNKAISSPDRETPYNPFHVKEFHLKELITLLGTTFEEVSVKGQKVREDSKGIAAKVLDTIPLKVKYLIPVAMQTKLSTLLRKPVRQADIDISDMATEADTFLIAVCKLPKSKPANLR